MKRLIIVVAVLLFLFSYLPYEVQAKEKDLVELTDAQWQLVEGLKNTVVDHQYKKRNELYFEIKKDEKILTYLKESKSDYYILYNAVGLVIRME